jgi:hypothetical protein
MAAAYHRAAAVLAGKLLLLPFLPFLFLLFLATRLTPLPAQTGQYAVTVAAKNPVRRITAALSTLDATDGPISRLEAARHLREAAEELEAAQVAAARTAGATWIEIGACYGLTKQGAATGPRPLPQR